METEDVEMVVCEHVACDECDTLENVENGDSEMVFVEAARWSNMTSGMFCSSHYCGCDDCGNAVYIGDVTIMGYNHSVCDSCREEYYVCERCDEWTHGDAVYYDDNDGCAYCESCYSERRPRPRQAGTCYACNTDRRHFDLLTERHICDCEADKLEIGLVMRRDEMNRILANV